MSDASHDRAGPDRTPEQQAEEPGQLPAHEPVTLSYAEHEELKTLARERDDYLKRLQRAVADYQNLQKRIEKFKESAYESVVRSVAEGILPMADSLSRALRAAEQTEGGERIVQGLRLMEKEFYGALQGLGIRPVEAVGQKFDPHYHEAAMQQQVEGAPPNTVVEELKKGFVLGDQVIRPSQVVVTAATSNSSQGGAAPDESRQEPKAQLRDSSGLTSDGP